MTDLNLQDAVNFLDLHYEAFFSVAPFATVTKHPVPMDTRGWSQVLVSILTGIDGVGRRKGADLSDGSDVKAANTWHAIDTPRFNGVIKAGTQATFSDDIASLDSMPHLYFVLWDETVRNTHRCRVWVVRPQHDLLFRAVCEGWYEKRRLGDIISSNFQLHPPRGLDSDEFRNNCGILNYPILFCAERPVNSTYQVHSYDFEAISSGFCKPLSVL